MKTDLESIHIDNIYQLENLDQVESLTSPIRYRMISFLTYRSKTSAQLARDLGISRPKAHYHLQVMVKLGFARFVGEKLVNGIVEKYYVSRAHFFSFDGLNQYAVDHPEDEEFCRRFASLKNHFLIN